MWTIKDEGKLKIEVDGSGFAMGAVLLQEQENQWRPLTHMSETYNSAERNYHTGDRELLAVMKALKKWRQHLIGTGPFEIWTDHRNLTYFQKPQNINRRQAGWVQKMQEYDFTLHYLEGKKNVRADALSRREGEEEKKKDNQDVVVLPTELFRRAVLEENEEVLVVEVEKEKILKEYHDAPLAGHPGVKRMKKLMEGKMEWSGMEKDIEEYVKGCQECQKNKPDRRKRTAPLQPLPITLHPWERISVDLIGPLPESGGYNAIMVVVDYFTKMKVFIPTTIELTAMGAAELFKNHAFKRFGIPKGVVSDRGPQFVAEFIKELWKSLGVKGQPSTAYHPQTDGQTERVNQELEVYL